MKPVRSAQWCSLALAIYCAGATFVCAGITGRVVVEGNPGPAERVVKAAGDPKYPGLGEVRASVWKVAPDGGLAEVVVQVPDAPATARPVEAVVELAGYRFVPPVVVVAKGGTVRFRSADDTLHNVRGVEPRRGGGPERSLFNVGQPRRGDESTVTFDRPGLVRIKSDVHTWMEGWVVVAENAAFAVTANDGTFSLPGLPDGEYTLRAWHDGFGAPLEQRFAVRDGTARIELAFNAPRAN